MNVIRFLVTTLVVGGLGLFVVGYAGAVPKPPPKFWSPARCERVLHAHDYALPTADGHRFHVGQRVCVGTGGPHSCRWTTGHSSRLFSDFRVFTRSRYIGGVVRSWTLTTRAGHGLVPIGHHAGDQYAGWPPDFYMSPESLNLLASNAAPARFRSIIAPMAARLTQKETTRCTVG